MNLFKLSGYLSIALGIACCACLINPFYLFFAMWFAIIGFIFSTINIYLNTKYEITKKSFSLGYIGMILSSVPVMFLLVLIIRGN
jgi:hypothetical protein